MKARDRQHFVETWTSHAQQLIYLANSDASLYPELAAMRDRLGEMIRQAADNEYGPQPKPAPAPFEPVQDGSRWRIRQHVDGGPNVLHAHPVFRSKVRAQDFADRLTAAATK